jgi:hypothetical protein
MAMRNNSLSESSLPILLMSIVILENILSPHHLFMEVITHKIYYPKNKSFLKNRSLNLSRLKTK